MRVLKVLISITLVLALALGITLWWATNNPERFKPELSELIYAQSGLKVEFNGKLSWTFFPQLRLTLENVQADWRNTKEPLVQLAALKFGVALTPLLSTKPKLRVHSIAIEGLQVNLIETQTGNNWTPPNHRGPALPPIPIPVNVLNNKVQSTKADKSRDKWQIDRFVVAGSNVAFRSSITDDFYSLRLTHLSLHNLRNVHPVALNSTFQFTNGDISLDAELDFTLTLDIPTDYTLTDFKSVERNVWEQAILPEDFSRLIDWKGDIEINELIVNTETFNDVSIHTEKHHAQTQLLAKLPNFFEGQASMQLEIDSETPPYRWMMTQGIKNANTQELIFWLDQKLEWAAPLILKSKMESQGNTLQSLLKNMQASTTFDGQQGNLNIAEIRRQALAVTRYTGGTERVANWPQILGYEVFTGTWMIDGSDHLLEIDLDNLSFNAKGKYDLIEDTVDMLVELTIHESPNFNSFNVNASLRGLPIPLRCTGSTKKPQCKLDTISAQYLLAKVLSGESNDALNAQLNEKIEELVPEEYQDTARALLKGFGAFLGSQSDQDN